MIDPSVYDETYRRGDTEYGRINGVEVTITQSHDPAMSLLNDPNVRSFSRLHPDKISNTCYICLDPEFSAMGLPLCYPCAACGGHVTADDTVCDECGVDQQELFMEAQIKACMDAGGHAWIQDKPHLIADIRVDKDGTHRLNEREYVPPICCYRCKIVKED